MSLFIAVTVLHSVFSLRYIVDSLCDVHKMNL